MCLRTLASGSARCYQCNRFYQCWPRHGTKACDHARSRHLRDGRHRDAVSCGRGQAYRCTWSRTAVGEQATQGVEHRTLFLSRTSQFHRDSHKTARSHDFSLSRFYWTIPYPGGSTQTVCGVRACGPRSPVGCRRSLVRAARSTPGAVSHSLSH